MITEAAETAPFAAFLDRMRFTLRVTVEDVTADMAVLAGLGAQPALPEGGPVWHDPWTATADGGVTHAAVDPTPRCRLRCVVRTGAPAARRRRGGDASRVTPGGGQLAPEALRIAAWRPGRRARSTRGHPARVDWLRSAVHLEKGCYRGQETVAKVHNLGPAPRRLVLLDLDGSEAVLPARRATRCSTATRRSGPSPAPHCTTRRARSRSPS